MHSLSTKEKHRIVAPSTFWTIRPNKAAAAYSFSLDAPEQKLCGWRRGIFWILYRILRYSRELNSGISLPSLTHVSEISPILTAFKTQADFIEKKNGLSTICDFIPGITPVLISHICKIKKKDFLPSPSFCLYFLPVPMD